MRWLKVVNGRGVKLGYLNIVGGPLYGDSITQPYTHKGSGRYRTVRLKIWREIDGTFVLIAKWKQKEVLKRNKLLKRSPEGR